MSTNDGVFLTFQITRERKYRFLHLKLKILGTAGELPDLPDPADPRHGAWCTTPGTLAPEVRMTVVLNKLPQANHFGHVTFKSANHDLIPVASPLNSVVPERPTPDKDVNPNGSTPPSNQPIKYITTSFANAKFSEMA